MACGEGIWDEESYRRYTEAQATVIRAVKGDVSADIRRIRKSLKLTQTELSEVVGIGKVAFSRYERGETKPPAPLVKLLKLFELHPDLIAEMHQSFSSPVEDRRTPRSSGRAKSRMPVRCGCVLGSAIGSEGRPAPHFSPE